MSTHLLIIDPQQDFCDPRGALFVPGADQDMDRLAAMIRRLSDQLDDIHVTLDSHHRVDISHPIWFVDDGGSPPPPFTSLGLQQDRIIGKLPPDYATEREYRTKLSSSSQRTREYLAALATSDRYPHTIWPEHCLIGSQGHSVHPGLFAALLEWEEGIVQVDFVTKGKNPWTEHFSAVKSEVEDPQDPSTQTNAGLIRTLEEADLILLAGEALSHCVANTVRDLADSFSDPEHLERLILLTDTSSNVPGFESLGEAFVKDLTARGMQTATTVDVLS